MMPKLARNRVSIAFSASAYQTIQVKPILSIFWTKFRKMQKYLVSCMKSDEMHQVNVLPKARPSRGYFLDTRSELFWPCFGSVLDLFWCSGRPSGQRFHPLLHLVKWITQLPNGVKKGCNPAQVHPKSCREVKIGRGASPFLCWMHLC